MTAGRVLRVFAITWRMHMKMLHRSVFDGVMQVVWPLFFATAALLIYRVHGDADALVYAALGASVMTIWTAISTTASAVLQRERGFGTLELLVAAPAPFPLSIAAIVSAVSTVGSYGMLATLVWARLLFGVELHLGRPLLFAGAVAATVLSFAVLGFVLCVTVVRYRVAWALSGLLEYPVWLVCGFLVRTGLLPEWLRPLSWALPPSWGMAAIRATVEGANPWRQLALCAGLAVAYGTLGVWLTETILRSARKNAALSLS
ncbi:ABC transporter permease [Dactylosporangium sp. NBC_01737]|uniref:ABC transporter permease n=1 Tax=Dactylosporangium sp. NBC_01737 TaxID=2975959 RepID=UPI002E153D7C|nr:ABC transporter permease [Dactylosporangium sp. NBC_01737]